MKDVRNGLLLLLGIIVICVIGYIILLESININDMVGNDPISNQIYGTSN